MQTFDLRSDTVTLPSQGVRDAMARAAVGDDCYHDDPTVRALEERVAALLGKEAAVFLPTGTMANQLAVHTHCKPGETLACPPRAHIQIHEDASAARLSGVQLMPLGQPAGFSAGQLEDLIFEETAGWPRLGLVWLENTLGCAGGLLWSLDEMRAIREVASQHSRPVHLDGARLWNAHVASEISLPELAACGDTVSVCLSKGLGAPAGSVLAGDADTIQHAWDTRHAFGGGMRQVGLLAAAGLWVLEHNIERLADDHARARRLADELADLPAWTLQQSPPTNVVIFETEGAAEDLCAPLREAGVLCYPNVYREVRLVTHLGIDDDGVEEIITRCRRVLA